MKDLQYIVNTKNNPEENPTEKNCTECVKQADFEVFLKDCYPEYRPNGTAKYPNYIERSYHIIKDNIEIAKIKALFKKNETDVTIEGRGNKEVFTKLQEKNTFVWQERDTTHFYPHKTQNN